VFLGGHAGAATASTDAATELRPSDTRPDLPSFVAPAAPGLVLPPLPPPERDSLAGDVRVQVRKIRVEGSTVFSSDELAQLTAPYENRVISSEQLLELRDALTRHYVDRGYINSGAVIPDQRVVDGIVALRITEGRLSAVELVGNKRLRDEWYSERVVAGAGRPLNLASLQSELLLLLQNSLITRLNAELVPGEHPGEAILRLKVVESDPWYAGVSLDNAQPVSTGSVLGSLNVGHRNLTGRGDMLAGSFGLTDGSSEGSLLFSLPLDNRDTTLAFTFSRTSASVVEEPFTSLDIDSDTEEYGITLSRPLIRTTNRQILTGLSLQRRHNETTLLGEPFSFSPGEVDGRSTVTVLRFSLDRIDRGQDRVLAARSTLSWGIDALGATDDPTPDGQFLAWLGQLQWARRWEPHQLILRGDLQLASDALLPLEQIAVGGSRTVRGYRENHLVRDQGTVASAEYRYAPPDLPPAARGLQLALFADLGYAWNHDDSPSDTLASIGVGLRYDPDPNLHAELYVGYRLKHVNYPDDDLQDDGVHFAFSYQLH
jgi:hemolysin activation/secretion protein